MAYTNSRLIARPAYAGLGGVWDSITSGVGKVFDFYGQAEQAKGAAAVLQAQQQGIIAQQQQGPGMGTVLLLGAAAVGLVLILRKKKHEGK